MGKGRKFQQEKHHQRHHSISACVAILHHLQATTGSLRILCCRGCIAVGVGRDGKAIGSVRHPVQVQPTRQPYPYRQQYGSPYGIWEGPQGDPN